MTHSSTQATIEVLRRRPIFRDGLGRYHVKIDDEIVGVAKRGRIVAFAVSPGPHQVVVEARSGRARSDPLAVTVPAGSRCELECFANGSTLTPVSDAFGSVAGHRPWIGLTERNSR